MRWREETSPPPRRSRRRRARRCVQPGSIIPATSRSAPRGGTLMAHVLLRPGKTTPAGDAEACACRVPLFCLRRGPRQIGWRSILVGPIQCTHIHTRVLVACRCSLCVFLALGDCSRVAWQRVFVRDYCPERGHAADDPRFRGDGPSVLAICRGGALFTAADPGHHPSQLGLGICRGDSPGR